MAPAWLWANDASKSWLSNTIDGKNASEFSTSTLEIIKSDKFREYFPEVHIKHDVSAKTFYQSTKLGRRYSLTTRGSNTGKHVDVISDDDPMDYKTAQSPQEAAGCIEGFKSLQTRKKDKSKTVYILGMQRLSSFDTVAHALKVLSDVDYICLPAEDTHNNIQPAALKEFYVDGLLDPVRLNRKILSEVKKGLTDDALPISDIAYAFQFDQLDQAMQGLLYQKLNFVDRLPDATQRIRKSFTDVADAGSDYFSTWFVEVNEHGIFIFDAIYTQDSSAVTSPLIKAKIQEHGSYLNKMETNNQGSVYITLLHTQGVPMTGYTNTGNKEFRITSYAQFADKVYFVNPNEHPNPQYRAAVKHLQSYPKMGKAQDGHDDAEDSFTEVLRDAYNNHRNLLIKQE